MTNTQPTSRRGRAAAERRAAAVAAARPDQDTHPDEYREWLFDQFRRHERTPAALAARLDRIDRHNLSEGRPREWSDEYRATKGLAAFDAAELRFRAQIRSRGGDVQTRRWDAGAAGPAAWTGGTFSHDEPEPAPTVADVLAELDGLNGGLPFSDSST